MNSQKVNLLETIKNMKKGAQRDRMRVNLKNCINDRDPRVWKFVKNVWKPPEFLGIKKYLVEHSHIHTHTHTQVALL